MSEQQAEDTERQGRMRKIRGLLDKAASTEFGPEADALREKAEALMNLHMITEFELALAGERPRMKAIKREYAYFEGDIEIDSDVMNSLQQMLYAIISSGRSIVAEFGWRKLVAVGFEEDLDFAELLYTTCKMELVLKMFPRYNPEMPDGQNIHIMKQAGYEWPQIQQELIRGGVQWISRAPFSKSVGYSMYTRMKTWLSVSGEEQVRVNAAIWRRSFTAGFAHEIRRRLDVMKKEAGQGESALILMKDHVREDYYEMYPDRRPHASDCKCSACAYVPPKGNNRRPAKFTAPKLSETAIQYGIKAAQSADLSGGRNRVGNKREAIS